MKVKLPSITPFVWVLVLGMIGCGVAEEMSATTLGVDDSKASRMQNLQTLGDNLAHAREVSIHQCTQAEDSLQRVDSSKYVQFHAFRIEADSLNQRLDSVLSYFQRDRKDSSDTFPQEVLELNAIYQRMRQYEANVHQAFCASDLYYFPEVPNIGEEMLYEMPQAASIIFVQIYKNELYSLLLENASCAQ